MIKRTPISAMPSLAACMVMESAAFGFAITW
jgi:hypothetical protein